MKLPIWVVPVIKVFIEGFFWSGLGIGILWLMLPAHFLDNWQPNPETDGLFANHFARRWDGGCHGWTQSLALVHIAGDLLTWTVYVCVAVSIARLHPILRRVPSSKYTVTIITALFVSCGGTHLWEVYATFQPVYRFTGLFKIIAAVIGLLGAIFVAHNLVSVFAVVKKEQVRLRELEAKAASELK